MNQPKFVLILTLLLIGTLGACAKPDPGTPAADYDRLLQLAAESDRKILIVFGADWCPDCHALDAHMQKAPLRQFLEEKYLVLKVDVCRYDCNMDFAAMFGHPEAEGIPALVVVNGAGKTLVATNNGEFASARSMPDQAVLDFLRRYADG